MKKNKFGLINLTFKNISEKEMTFDQVFNRIKTFMKKEPLGNFKLMIGTDSQVFHDYTRFVTGIVIQKEGKGAWACYKKINIPRPLYNLHEKISMETSFTEEIAFNFNENKKEELIEIILPYIYKGSSLSIEGHIDIGKEKRNKTREFVNEMVNRIEATGMEPKIKPYAIAASGYANKYTK